MLFVSAYNNYTEYWFIACKLIISCKLFGPDRNEWWTMIILISTEAFWQAFTEPCPNWSIMPTAKHEGHRLYWIFIILPLTLHGCSREWCEWQTQNWDNKALLIKPPLDTADQIPNPIRVTGQSHNEPLCTLKSTLKLRPKKRADILAAMADAEEECLWYWQWWAHYWYRLMKLYS